MSTSEDEALLGRIAVRNRFITMDQLTEATKHAGVTGQRLGTVMLELSLVTERQLATVLALQKRHRENVGKRRGGQKPRRKPIPTPPPLKAFTGPNSPQNQQAIEDARERAARAARTTPRERPVPKSERPTNPGRRIEDLLPDKLGSSAPPPSERASFRPPPKPPREDASGDETPDDTLRSQASSRQPPRAERPTPPSRPAPAPRTTPSEASSPPPDEVAASEQSQRSSVPAADSARRVAQSQRRQRDTNPDAAKSARRDSDAAVRRRDTDPQDWDAALRPTPYGDEAHLDALERAVAEAADTSERPTDVPPAPDSPTMEPLPWDQPAASDEVKALHDVLAHAVKSQASDVHVHAGRVAMMRQLGRLVPLTDDPIDPEATKHVLEAMLTPWQAGRLRSRGEVDFAYHLPGVARFRANVYHHQGGTNGVFHIIPEDAPTLTTLGLPTALAKLTTFAQGMVLVTGPSGCGKTSTVAALLRIINEERYDHILTIEDPVEYVHPSIRCVVNQRQVGRHTESFARGLRGALREDPDVICIGELRDLETISLAMSAAETGHLVFGTLHTRSAIGTINRIVGAYPPGQQPQVRAMMSESLRAVISQQLVPRADGNGVVPVLETLYVNRAVGSLIRDNRTFQINSVLQTGKSQGMQLFDTSLRELVEEGVISREEALRVAHDPRQLGGEG